MTHRVLDDPVERGEGDDDELVGVVGHAGTYCRHDTDSSLEPSGRLEVGEDAGILEHRDRVIRASWTVNTCSVCTTNFFVGSSR